MIALIQRVTRAHVDVDGETVGEIATGLLAFVAVEPDDTEARADRLLERLLGYRIFPDTQDKMNLALRDTGGGLLLVPQFTLAADTRKGMRPSFASAAPPVLGERLYGYLLARARAAHLQVESGRFGAHMRVHLVNDGPVTFWLTA